MDEDAKAAARVYEAVVAGESADTLRTIIEECAVAYGSRAFKKGVEARRLAAVNTPVLRPQQQQQRQQPQQEGAPGEQEKELPLAAACRLDRHDLICVLVEQGADVEQVYGPNATPLGVCIACGDDDAEASVRALLRHGRADARAPVPRATWNKYALVWEIQSEPRTCTAAHLCVSPSCSFFDRAGPRLRCLDVLVREGGADISATDSDGLTPLAWLGQYSWKSYECDLLDAGLPALLQLGADPNRAGRGRRAAPPALHWIRSWSGSPATRLIACLRALRAAGARLSGGVTDGQGDTPLTLAAQMGFHAVVRFLLEEVGADVHESNRVTGALPLTCCIPEPEIVSALLAAGADANRADRLGRRPLLHVLSPPWPFYDEEPPAPGVALALLRAGASANVRGPHGETPLLMACDLWPPTYLSDDRVRLLLELLRRTPEADRRATLQDGRSAIDVVAGDRGEWLDGDRHDRDFMIEDIDPLPDDAVPAGVEEDEEPLDAFDADIEAAFQRSIAAHRRIVAELLVAGAHVRKANRKEITKAVAQDALAIAARRATRATRELAARRSEGRHWRGLDCFVQLALEESETRAARGRLDATRARLAALGRAIAEAEG
jgi:ankyrin repeat protein